MLVFEEDGQVEAGPHDCIMRLAPGSVTVSQSAGGSYPYRWPLAVCGLWQCDGVAGDLRVVYRGATLGR